MSYGLINTSDLTDIADAIRIKLGVQTAYKPGQMADAIESISGGGITPTGTKTITQNGTYDVTRYASAEVSVPPSGITPTGTKQISVTENGTKTEDVTNYASVQISTSVVNQDYVNALTALGVQSDLADSITTLTTYANGITGQSDTDLSDAVHTLGSGYGGLEYEEGTYSPSTDEIPTISFANSHTKAPDVIVFANVGAWQTPDTGAMNMMVYVSFLALFGVAWAKSSSASWANVYFVGRLTANKTDTTVQGYEYIRGNVSASGFEPYAGSSAYVCKAGQTYKWIAIWK